jgi:hypothetical protein
MLTADDFDTLADPITRLFADFETSVLEDIARRLRNLDFTSAAWQAQRVTEAGSLYEDVVKKLARLNHTTEEKIRQVLEGAGVQAVKFDDSIYTEAGLDPKPLNLSPAMLDVLKAGIEKTGGVVTNLTKTTAITSQSAFIKAADLAYMQVSTGAMSYDQAIKAAIKRTAAAGLDVIDFATGHKDKLDVAMRRTVLTGVAQTTNQLTDTRADEMGADLVQVSAHAGARNEGPPGPANHASWQGKIYSRSGKHPKYPDFVKATGYGTGAGLGGWNCRHTFYPYFEGVSEAAYTRAEVKRLNRQKVKYQGKDIDQYQASQIQREIERRIRYWKRQAAALEAGKQDATAETAKVKEWQNIMRDFIRQTDLDRQRVREQVVTP